MLDDAKGTLKDWAAVFKHIPLEGEQKGFLTFISPGNPFECQDLIS